MPHVWLHVEPAQYTSRMDDEHLGAYFFKENPRRVATARPGWTVIRGK